MRTNILFASVLASALVAVMPVHAQVLGGGGGLVGGATGNIGGALGGTVGHLGGNVGGGTTGSLDGMGHLDTNTLHEQELAARRACSNVPKPRSVARRRPRATSSARPAAR
jgi:hypothetical protein